MTVSRDWITIVSGLPRSGTSMMMQMLEAGGIPILSDGVRKADEDNPKGYYELEAVKKTEEDDSWVPDAVGRAVKMVHLLLYHLPQGFRYRVVLMRRRIEEVLASQRKMLTRLGKTKESPLSEQRMGRIFEQQLAKLERWLEEDPRFEWLPVRYDRAIARPREPVRRLDDFLGGGLDVDAMAAVVDPTLYRNRAS